VKVLSLDNASFASVRKLVDEVEKENITLDFLFFNAGFPGAASHEFTEDGHELTYQTNFLSSFLMTHMLLSRDLLSSSARIIFTASTGQYGGLLSKDFQPHSTNGELEPGFHGPPYTKSGIVKLNASSRYANTKLMQCAFTRVLQQHFDSVESKPNEMSAHVFTPSYCSTPIFGKTDSPSLFNDPLFWFLVVSTKIAVPVEEGAATGVFLALKDGIENGGYWDRCVRRVSNADVMSEDLLDKLWRRWSADAGVEWDLK
jgi:NAD(P)-dependent dehydrogenase (short-subunit alcohol dehydrogenase family)